MNDRDPWNWIRYSKRKFDILMTSERKKRTDQSAETIFWGCLCRCVCVCIYGLVGGNSSSICIHEFVEFFVLWKWPFLFCFFFLNKLCTINKYARRLIYAAPPPPKYSFRCHALDGKFWLFNNQLNFINTGILNKSDLIYYLWFE